jgi:hypothetical protein
MPLALLLFFATAVAEDVPAAIARLEHQWSPSARPLRHSDGARARH